MVMAAIEGPVPLWQQLFRWAFWVCCVRSRHARRMLTMPEATLSPIATRPQLCRPAVQKIAARRMSRRTVRRPIDLGNVSDFQFRLLPRTTIKAKAIRDGALLALDQLLMPPEKRVVVSGKAMLVAVPARVLRFL